MEKKTKIYQINNITYKFNSDKFAVLCNDRSKLMKLKKTSLDFLLQLEEELNGEVSSSTIKGWMYGINSPATLDVVEKLASIFKLDKMDLLIENERIKKMKINTQSNVDEKTREVVCEIYGRFVDAIREYKYSDGFTDPSWGDITHESLFIEWVEKADTLESIIRKSRPYIDKDTVQSLLVLCGRIFEYFEYEKMHCSLYDLTDSKGEPTDYQKFLGDCEDNGQLEMMFLSKQIDEFNDRLEDILDGYLA